MARHSKDYRAKVQEYSDRHQFWTEQAITQYGISINLFFVIGIGILAYLAGLRPKFDVAFCFNCDIHWPFVVYIFIALLTFLSVIFGSVSVLSRLYDLRLTRHTLWIRKKAAEKNILLPDKFVDISSVGLVQKFQNLLKVLSSKDFFINNTDLDDLNALKEKFRALKRRNILLGDFSWLCHKFQVALLSMAIFLYAGVIMFAFLPS